MFISNSDYFYKRILRANEEQLQTVLNKKMEYYTSYSIPKKNGVREIKAIDKEKDLYYIQKNLLNNFLSIISLPTCVKGFVKGESYNSFLAAHVGKKYYLRIDIKSFFGSITKNQIKDNMSEFTNLEDVINNIVEICTFEDKLPQGAVTSPAISNIIFRRIDQRITRYCQSFNIIYKNGIPYKENITYTRYADDVLFSSNEIDFKEEKFFYKMIKKILQSNGFECNYSKKRTDKDFISLSGYVIGNDIHLSRNKLKNINKILYFFDRTKDFTHKKYRVKNNIFSEKDWLKKVNDLNLIDDNGSKKTFSNEVQLLDYLCGYRSFIISVIQTNDTNTKYVKQMSNKVKKIECIIDSIDEHKR